MPTLGEPYTILYISKMRSGLTDVQAVVLKPDLSQAGVFPMAELPGLFVGCYFYDYYSSTSDPKGQYFSRVYSPTEDVVDIVRFEMNTGGGTGGDIVIPPTNLVATIVDSELMAYITDENDVWTYVRADQVRGVVASEETIVGVVSDNELSGDVNSNSTVAITDR